MCFEFFWLACSIRKERIVGYAPKFFLDFEVFVGFFLEIDDLD